MPKVNRPGVFFPFFLFLMAVLCVGLWVFLTDYYSYAAKAIEDTNLQVVPNKETLQVAPVSDSFDTEVKYRKFFITVFGAKQVELAADFNRWGKDPIILQGYRKGYFETSVALSAGEYKYVFIVDGKEVLDPNNKDRRTVDGREVCIKTVK